MELPHVRRANDPAELLRLLRDWEAGGCASALSRLFVLFAAGHPWGTEAAEEVLLPRLPSAGCLITACLHDRILAPSVLYYVQSYPASNDSGGCTIRHMACSARKLPSDKMRRTSVDPLG